MKKDFLTEPAKGYLDLSDHPLPPEEEEREGDESDGYEPSIAPDQEELPTLGDDSEATKFDMPIKRYRTKGPQAFGPVKPPDYEDPQPEVPERDPPAPAPLPDIQEDQHMDETHKREHGGNEEDQHDEPSTKRSRTEYLEIYFAKVESLLKSRQKKEMRYQALDEKSKKCFDQAIKKEFKNNTDIGAYRALSVEESASIRQTMPEKIMESRLVLTAKPLEPHEVEPARQEGLLLDRQPGDLDGEPCKAKARHVMKGYSEEGADEIEAATPQVT